MSSAAAHNHMRSRCDRPGRRTAASSRSPATATAASRWADECARTRTGANEGMSLFDLGADGMKERLQSLFRRAKEAQTQEIEVPIACDTRIETWAFRGKPDGNGGVLVARARAAEGISRRASAGRAVDDGDRRAEPADPAPVARNRAAEERARENRARAGRVRSRRAHASLRAGRQCGSRASCDVDEEPRDRERQSRVPHAAAHDHGPVAHPARGYRWHALRRAAQADSFHARVGGRAVDARGRHARHLQGGSGQGDPAAGALHDLRVHERPARHAATAGRDAGERRAALRGAAGVRSRWKRIAASFRRSCAIWFRTRSSSRRPARSPSTPRTSTATS